MLQFTCCIRGSLNSNILDHRHSHVLNICHVFNLPKGLGLKKEVLTQNLKNFYRAVFEKIHFCVIFIACQRYRAKRYRVLKKCWDRKSNLS